MRSVGESWTHVWENLRGRVATVKRGTRIPPDRVSDNPAGDLRFEPGKHYFSVIINEMYLTKARQWFDVYDPMALVVTEFSYGGAPIVVPFVVGPSLVASSIAQVPAGFQITDTKVAGVHPYAGGSFALTVVLAQVKRESYAKGLLTFVETVSKTFPAGAALAPCLKVAGAVLDGVESLFGMTETKALIGHRWEYNHEDEASLQAGFTALADADVTEPSLEKLRVKNSRLITEDDAEPYRSTDFLLYKLARSERRDDAKELPFNKLFQSVLLDAASNDGGAWDRAKAGLVSLYREIITSPDITWSQGQELMATYKDHVLEAHKEAVNFGTLAGKGTGKLQGRQDSKTLGVPLGVNHDDRVKRLSSIHELLRLS